MNPISVKTKIILACFICQLSLVYPLSSAFAQNELEGNFKRPSKLEIVDTPFQANSSIPTQPRTNIPRHRDTIDILDRLVIDTDYLPGYAVRNSTSVEALYRYDSTGCESFPITHWMFGTEHLIKVCSAPSVN